MSFSHLYPVKIKIMHLVCKSAVQTCFAAKLLFGHYLFLSSRLSLASQTMGWQSEKEKYLTKFETRSDPSWTKLDDIQTWKQYAAEEDLPAASKPLSGNTIDAAKNNVLVDKVSIFTGDITKLKVDAIVNAANSYLKRGGGVDGAIHRIAGEYLQQECDTLHGCPTGEAKLTGGYQLPAKYVIQTVGPQGENSQALRNCYQNSLKLAIDNNIRSIAFPCISTGIYGYPNEAAAHVATYTVRNFLEQHSAKIDRVIFVTFLDIDKNLYEGILQTYFPISKNTEL